MTRTGAVLSALVAVALLAGCATSGPSPLPTGQAAYEAVPEVVPDGNAADTIQPGDKLIIKVYGEQDLSDNIYVVDTTGYIQVPLIGDVIAAQQTPRALAAEIERRLSLRFVRNPSVTVAVTDRPQATYAVEGDVTAPGVFAASVNTTLLTAMAQAKSPTKTAKLSDVVVFRRINGKRAGGRFNLLDIRRGRASDPQILAGDTIVVGNSAIKSAWRDFLQAAPLFSVFYALNN